MAVSQELIISPGVVAPLKLDKIFRIFYLTTTQDDNETKEQNQ